MNIRTFDCRGTKKVYLLSYAHRVGEKQIKLEEVGLFISKSEAHNVFKYIEAHTDEQISESVATMYFSKRDLINPSIPLYLDLENYLIRNDITPEV